MKYADLEDAIVSRLSAKLGATATVIALPEVQAQNQRPFDKARVTVAYNSSMFDGGRYGNAVNVMSVDGTVQEESIKIKVSIESKKLRGTGGIYELLVAVRQAVIGFEPLGLDQMKILESKFDEFTENLWSYMIVFETKGFIIQDVDPVDEPLITAVDFDQNFPISI